MASLKGEALFTKIALQETIDICVENLFENTTHVGNISKDSFKNLLSLAVYKSFFVFDGNFYKQCDSVAMGSP